MKFRKLSIAVFLISLILGIIFVVSTKKESATKNDLIEFDVKDLKPAPIKAPESEIIPYEIAKNFGGFEILDEKYLEKEIKYKYDFLTTGEFHGDEVTAKSGENWIGLFGKDKDFSAISTKINVTSVYDEIVDGENKNKKTGKKVSVAKDNEPLFLIKNANSLKEGKVQTLFMGLSPIDENTTDKFSTELKTDAAYNYKIGGKNYELKVEKILNKEGEKIFALILSSDDKKQILHTSTEDYLGVLYWVGDLDNDNKPDFYFSPWIKENIVENSLFISSEADEKNLVKKVASMSSSGC